jgi:protein-S-isoprenylcysteine O-methyltransferase Ste14
MTLATFPTLFIGLLVGAYWARVLKMAYKTKLRTGRAANLVPTEPLGLALRVIWYPAVALWIALPLLAGFGKPLTRPWFVVPIVAWIAAAIALAAFIATLICWKRMGTSWRMGINPDETTPLIVTGPYAYVRHPIYALSSLLMLATLAALPTTPMAIVAAVHLVLLQWEARREERHMLATHGQRYGDYLARVGRFIPKSTRAFTG